MSALEWYAIRDLGRRARVAQPTRLSYRTIKRRTLKGTMGAGDICEGQDCLVPESGWQAHATTCSAFVSQGATRPASSTPPVLGVVGRTVGAARRNHRRQPVQTGARLQEVVCG